jgi:hypothetical protein
VTGFASPGSPRNVACNPRSPWVCSPTRPGFALMVNAFEGNKAETTTMLPVIKAFMAAHHLKEVVIVADAGMISDKNIKDIEAAGLSFILGMKIPEVPDVISEWQREHPGEPVPDGQVFVQPWPAGSTDKRTRQDTSQGFFRGASGTDPWSGP